MRFLILIGLLLCPALHAHEVQTITQHINLRRQNLSGIQQDVMAKFDYSRRFDFGLQATYLERFNIYDKRAGGYLVMRPDEKWTLEGKFLQGMGNEIMARKEATYSAWYSYGQGLSPFASYTDSRYSITHLNRVNLGIEIEKIQNIIIIPSLMIGKATFKSPSETHDVNNFGLRVIYYLENYHLGAFAFKGKEASQGIVGRSARIINTLTGGMSLGYHFSKSFRSELTFDHTDYDELQTEFHTTTLNLRWTI